MNNTTNENIDIAEKSISETVFGNINKIDEKTQAKAVAKQANINTTFKWVRYGLSMLFTALILCIFSLFYIRPGAAPFYVCIMTLVFIAVGFFVVITAAKKAGKSYNELAINSKKRGEDE